MVDAHVATGDETCVLIGDELVLVTADGREVIARLDEVPMTLGGAARHNVSNALGAICVARRLGLPLPAIRDGLMRFDSSPAREPRPPQPFRPRRRHRAIVDFRSQPPRHRGPPGDGSQALPSERWCVLVGQAGDRDEESIRELPRAVWKARPDRVIVKELVHHLRGREAGEGTGR